MLKHTSLALVLSVVASVFGVGCAGHADEAASDEGAATAGAALAHDYQGKIGTHDVYVRLDGHGAALTGSYFYASTPSTGDALVLEGSQSGNKITLTESVNGAGATTGTFSGTVTAAGINGTWKSPTGASSPLALTAIAPGSIKIVTRKYAKKVKFTDGDPTFPQDCSLDATAIEVFGLADAKAEAAITKALAIDPIELDAGKCKQFLDIRTITQSVTMNQSGFLTIASTTESDGGAHPEISVDQLDFRLSDGVRLTGKDFFAPGAGPALKALLVKHINAETDLDAATKKDTLDELDNEWSPEMDPDAVQFALTPNGLTLDMTNNYPHVVLALAPSADFTWAELAPLLKSDSPIKALIH